MQFKTLSRRRCLQHLGGGLGLASSLGSLASLTGCAAVPEGPTGGSSVSSIVPPFLEKDVPGGQPQGWAPYILRQDKALTQYRLVIKDDRPAVQAVANNAATGFAAEVNIDPAKTPWLEWSWRLDQHIAGADVSDLDKDDSPLRIVVGFEGNADELSYKDQVFFDQVRLFTGKDLPFASIMYLWDEKLRPEVIVPYSRTTRIQFLNVQSGSAGLGRWTSHRRNLSEDYRRIFGKPPGRVSSIGLLTDSDDFKLRVEAWYGSLSVRA